MKLFRSLCATAIAMLAVFSASAQEQFCELSVYPSSSSEFKPDNNIHKMGQSYNEVYTYLGVKPINAALSNVKAGDVFKFVCINNGQSTDLNTVTITNVSSGSKYTYKIGNSETTKTVADITTILIATKVPYKANEIPNKETNAQLQMVYIRANGEILYSNIVNTHNPASTLSTEVKVESLYRSGTPDPANNAAQELYTCRVKFKPLEGNNIVRYDIYKNASEVVASISQGDAMKNKDSEGFFSIRFDEPLTKKANKYENSSSDFSQPVVFGDDLFFTVVVADEAGNTYGNVDRDAQYTGSPAELVYNSTINAFTDHHGNFRAEINWNKIPSSQTVDADDYVLNDPDYYTVYRGIINEDGDTVYTPITARYIGHDGDITFPSGELDKGGFTKVDQTTDGSAYKFTKDLIKEIEETRIEGFKVFDFISLDDSNTPNSYPAMYYVKAHYDSYFNGRATYINATGDLQNYIEKNSNPTPTSIPIVTEIEDLQTSQVVSVKYYNLMGIEVAQPEAGEIVVARTQYANGVVTSKVIKK